MKKILLALSAALLLVAALLLTLVLALGGTQGGTRLLAGQLSRLTGDSLAWEQLQGTLLGELELQGVSYRQPGQSVAVNRAHLKWRPNALLGGRLEIEQLRAEGIRVELAETDQPAEAGSPLRLSDFRPPMDFSLRDLQIRDLQLVTGDGAPQVVEQVSLAATYFNDQLQVEQLSVQLPAGGLDARGELGFAKDSPLSLDLDWRWTLPDGRPLGGQLQASGNNSSLALVHRGGGDLPIDLTAELMQPLDAPDWRLRVEWPELLVAEGDVPLVLQPGHLESEGNLDAFGLQSKGSVLGLAPAALDWSLQAQGDRDQLELSSLQLDYSPALLDLSGRLHWDGAPAFDLQYRAAGDGLDELNPELPARLDAHGVLRGRYREDQLELEQFDLALQQSPLRLSLQGNLALAATSEPHFDGAMSWSDLQWPLVAAEPSVASASGRLQVAGTAADYAIELAADTSGSEIPPGQWRGQASGNQDGLTLHSLRSELLGGALELSGPVLWAPMTSWELELRGEELDPGHWLPDYPGQLALLATSAGRLDPDSGPIGSFELSQFAGLIAQQPVVATARILLQGDRIDVPSLQLGSGDNNISAAGQLSEDSLDLTWQLELPSPGGLYPNASGQLHGSGRVQGSPQQPRLQASLRSDGLALDTLSLDQLSADVRAGLNPEAPLEIDLQLGTVSDNEQLLLAGGQLTASGTTARHSLELELQGSEERLLGRLSGGLDAEGSEWRGKVSQLEAEAPQVGSWRLVDETALLLSAQAAKLGTACLQPAAEPGRICVQGNWSPTTGSTLDGRVDDLSIGRFLSGVSGELNGTLDAELDAAGALRTQARLTLGEGQIQVPGELDAKPQPHGGGRFTLNIGEAGLDAALEFAAPQNGRLHGDLQLPNLTRLPLADAQPLSGGVRASLPDLAGLAALVPTLSSSAGRVEADLDLTGTLDEPRIQGQLALTDGAAAIPDAGLQVRDIQFRAYSDPGQPGVMLLQGGLASGPGRVDLTGSLVLPDGTLELVLQGERLELYNTEDGFVRASPDLQIGWSDQLLRLRGSILIPEAAITPRLSLSPAGTSNSAEPVVGQVIGPSPDVVIVEAEDAPQREVAQALPFRVDSRVELALGDGVPVNAVGFVSRVVGAATFTNDPRQPDLTPSARGRLTFEEGTFRAFGQDLEIETGQIIFTGGPVTQPDLVVRAVRWIDDDPLVTAVGVLVSGSVNNPTIELFSRPQLEPTEIQSYLLTGRSSTTRDNVLSIGTYLHPRIYVGYGYNMLEKTNEFNSLFTITPRWGVGASFGEADNNVNMTFTHER